MRSPSAYRYRYHRWRQRRRLQRKWPNNPPELLLGPGDVLSERKVQGLVDMLHLDLTVAAGKTFGDTWRAILAGVSTGKDTIPADIWNAIVSYATWRDRFLEQDRRP